MFSREVSVGGLVADSDVTSGAIDVVSLRLEVGVIVVGNDVASGVNIVVSLKTDVVVLGLFIVVSCDGSMEENYE